VIGKVTQRCLIPANIVRFRSGDFTFDFRQDCGSIQPLAGADLAQGFAATAAEIDAMASEDACGQGMLGGNLANLAIGMNGHGQDSFLMFSELM
jgi:hypothetical protein